MSCCNLFGDNRLQNIRHVKQLNNPVMKKGEKVHWQWGKSEAEGKVHEKFTEPVSKKIGGTDVKRKASEENPAWLIKQENGSEVLKFEKELMKGKES